MLDTFFAGDALLFTVPALFGTLVFIVKIGLMALGGAGDGLDVDADVDVDTDIAHGDSTGAFSFISIQSIAAFIMGFGWGGLIGLKTFEWGLPVSAVAGIAFGVALMWLLGLMLKAIWDLQSSGNVDIRDAIGAEGTVYAGIPARGEGRGQVRIVISERARICNAVSEGEALPTSSTVRVTRVNNDNTLTVVRAT